MTKENANKKVVAVNNPLYIKFLDKSIRAIDTKHSKSIGSLYAFSQVPLDYVRNLANDVYTLSDTVKEKEMRIVDSNGKLKAVSILILLDSLLRFHKTKKMVFQVITVKQLELEEFKTLQNFYNSIKVFRSKVVNPPKKSDAWARLVKSFEKLTYGQMEKAYAGITALWNTAKKNHVIKAVAKKTKK